MRLHFSLSPNRQPVPFNYVSYLTSTFHRWLGQNNDLHDGISLYSLGWFQGGGARNGALHFPNGASWFISAPDTSDGNRLLETIATSALRSPMVCNGMEVVEIYSQSTPDFGSPCLFKANSPIFIRGEKEGDKDPHILYHDERADTLLTRTLQKKLQKAGLGHLSEEVQVCFDRTYKTPKVKLIFIKEGSKHDFYKKASFCPVIVEGEPEAVQFAWNVGAGNLSGSGFGSLV